MVDAKSCNGCSQAHDCKRIYEQLGHTGGPSVALKVIMAFALPIILFVAALAIFGHLLHERLSERTETPVAFVLAAAVTVGVMLVVSAGQTKRDSVQTSKGMLEKVNANLIGAVLTNVPLDASLERYYYAQHEDEE